MAASDDSLKKRAADKAKSFAEKFKKAPEKSDHPVAGEEKSSYPRFPVTNVSFVHVGNIAVFDINDRTPPYVNIARKIISLNQQDARELLLQNQAGVFDKVPYEPYEEETIEFGISERGFLNFMSCVLFLTAENDQGTKLFAYCLMRASFIPEFQQAIKKNTLFDLGQMAQVLFTAAGEEPGALRLVYNMQYRFAEKATNIVVLSAEGLQA